MDTIFYRYFPTNLTNNHQSQKLAVCIRDYYRNICSCKCTKHLHTKKKHLHQTL